MSIALGLQALGIVGGKEGRQGAVRKRRKPSPVLGSPKAQPVCASCLEVTTCELPLTWRNHLQVLDGVVMCLSLTGPVALTPVLYLGDFPPATSLNAGLLQRSLLPGSGSPPLCPVSPRPEPLCSATIARCSFPTPAPTGIPHTRRGWKISHLSRGAPLQPHQEPLSTVLRGPEGACPQHHGGHQGGEGPCGFGA